MANRTADLELSFDVGHSSIGWAVLQTKPSLEIKGCGAVIFRADDCLASKRRDFRRQRRHIRSTRQRIRRLKALLLHLGVLKKDQLEKPKKGACAWPWKLATGVLVGGKTLTWPELWDVLRWYAHNRGYDGNRRWSGGETDEDEDTKKEKIAIGQLAEYENKYKRKGTMAEVFCERLDVLNNEKCASGKRFKDLGAAFPRDGVEDEVRRILRAHVGKLPHVDAEFERVLIGNGPNDKEAWKAIPWFEKPLPQPYEGGLLFGQLVPRFDNRIISKCPITGQNVPGRHSLEFLDFRWAMTLANVRVGFGSESYRDRDGKESNLRPLTADELHRVDARVRKLGFLKLEPDKPGKDGHMRAGKNEFREILQTVLKCDRHNLDTLLMHPDAKEALKLMPVAGNATAFRVAWACFDEPKHDEHTGAYHDDLLRRRFATQLLRGTKRKPRELSLYAIIAQLEKPEVVQKHPDAPMIAQRIRESAKAEVTGKKLKSDPEKLTELMAAPFHCDRNQLTGRARYCRNLLRQAVQQVFRKEGPIHPLEKGGCLEQTAEVKQSELNKDLAKQTNNHLVRHRLMILAGDPKAKPHPKEGLLQHIINDFAGGDKRRIARITVEVARDIQEMSGMDSIAKKDKEREKLRDHKQVSEKLAAALIDAGGKVLQDGNGKPLMSAGLIRKARLLSDLKQQCPYTMETIEFVHLTAAHPRFGTADKDHIIPRSQRLSDALEAQVITFSELNHIKDKRTSLQFIRDMNKPENKHIKDRFGIKSEAQYRTFVDSLGPKRDPFKRARAGGPRPTDDEARCWRRKQLLLTEKWEEKEFTPADLAQTRHVTKLAMQRLEAAFLDLPKEQQPPVIAVTGAVTAAFRDKSWKLWRELKAVHPEVKRVLDEGEELRKQGKDFNPKKAVRAITHLHHAVDATALALVTRLLVPEGHQSLNSDLARCIVKGRLTAEERTKFEALRHQFGLSKFYRWAAGRCDDESPHSAERGQSGTLCLDELPEWLEKMIQKELASKRVIQHIPADRSGLDCDATVYRVFDPHDEHPNARRLHRWFDKLVQDGTLTHLPDPNDPKEPRVLLTARKRRNDTEGTTGKTLHDTGKEWRWIYLLKDKSSVHGLHPGNGKTGKLKALKAATLLGNNFGVAQITIPGHPPRYQTLRPRLVSKELKKIRKANPGATVELIRTGMLVEVKEDDGTMKRLRIFGCGERSGKRGIYIDVAEPDAINRDREIPISAFIKGNATLLKTTLTGQQII